ncbi:hypothetical protein [Aliiroseovarius crassostreae]|nr:hypothetical protein [Aliiroseovarius crassostreae]
MSMVPMASDVKLDLSMRIERHGDLAKVAVAAEVSVNGRDCMSGGPERRI